MTKKEEIFKDLYLNEEKTNYKISNFGNVYSLFSKKILKTHIDNWGYIQTELQINKNPMKVKIHRLVAVCFLNLDYNNKKIQVDHIDGNKTNNNVDNLRLCTPKENMSFFPDQNKKIINQYNSKVTIDIVKNMRKDFSENNNISIAELSRKYDVTYKAAYKICKNQSYKNI